MGFLGYDSERLLWLSTAMRRTADKLAAIHNDDPAISASMVRVRSAERVLSATWLPVIGRMLSCDVLGTEYAPVHLDGTDVRTAALFMLQGYGWQVATDPLGQVGDGTIRVTGAEARAIGALLSRSDISELIDTPEELAWLRQRLLVIGADPKLAADLAANLDTTWVLAVLADEHLDAAATGDWTRATQLAEVIAACATAVREHETAWVDELIELDPYAAALALRGLDLHGEELAAACDRILARWRNPPDGGGWPDADVGPTYTADLLLPLLIADPDAATAFLQRAAAHPDIVFQTTNDGVLVRELLLVGTDPAHVSATAAGEIMVPTLEWLRNNVAWFHDDMIGGEFDARELLGELAAPWLLYFGPRVEDWGWSISEGKEILQFVVDDGRALDDLLAAMEQWRIELLVRPLVDADGRIDAGWATDMAGLFILFDEVITKEVTDDARAARIWVDLLASAVTTVGTSFGDGAIGLTVSATVPFVVSQVQDLLTDAGILPPDADLVAEMARAETAQRKATTAIFAIVALAAQLVDSGDLPEDALDGLDLGGDGGGCDARAVRDRLQAFIDGLRDRCSATVYNAFVALLSTFLSPDAINDVC